MSLHRPRRIFRASSKAQALGGIELAGSMMRPAVLAGLLGMAFGAVVMLFLAPSDLFGRVPPLAGTITAAPELVAVVDGETLRLREMVVRLQGVAAPPRGLSCHATNGGVSDCGAASATALADLVRGHGVACRLHGRDSAGLAQGVCEADGTELNRTLVAEGWARALDASGMNVVETAARQAHRGLWRDGTMPGF